MIVIESVYRENEAEIGTITIEIVIRGTGEKRGTIEIEIEREEEATIETIVVDLMTELTQHLRTTIISSAEKEMRIQGHLKKGEFQNLVLVHSHLSTRSL